MLMRLEPFCLRVMDCPSLGSLSFGYATWDPTNRKQANGGRADVSSWPDPILFPGTVVFRSTPSKRTMPVLDLARQ